MAGALVTGGGARLGRAMALYLGRRGYDVAVHYATSAHAAEAVVDEIKAMGRSAIALKADLLEDTATGGLVQRAVDAIGPLTVLVNNASIFEYDTLETATRDSWDRHFNSNLKAPFVLTQGFAAQVPALDTAPDAEPVARGLVVNMLDQRVWKLTPEFMTYTLAKAALWTFTQTAARGLAPRIRVNGIGPGPTLQGHRQSDEHFANQRAATILERGADPEDITAALGYLLDARAVTGQMIAVDGGQHLGWKTPDVLGPE